MSVLRDATEADIPVLFEHQREPEGVEMALFPPRDYEAFDAHWRKLLADPTLTKKTIVCDGKVAGNIGAWTDADGHRLVGYWIGSEFWGRGLATQALRELIQHETTRPLVAHVATSNVASIRVLEKCGFVVTREVTEFDERLGVDVELKIMELAGPRPDAPTA